VTRFIARLLYFRRLRSAGLERDSRIRTWRDLSIDWSANVNPYAHLEIKETLPLNLEREYVLRPRVVLLGTETITLDDLNQDDGEGNLARLRECYDAYGRGGDPKVLSWWAHVYYVQAGWSFFNSGDSLSALRCFLNATRMHGSGAELEQNIAMCAVELGELSTAVMFYVRGGEGSSKDDRPLEAADAWERAGLIWEAVARGNRRPPGLTTGKMTYDSTAALAKAKALYAANGDYMSASRCSIAEMDSSLRWTPSGVRRLALRIARAVWLYGESPLYALRTLVVAMVIFSVLYLFAGFGSAHRLIDYDLTMQQSVGLGEFLQDLGTALYFSAVTMATLGHRC
jgi:hypothetical protein